MFSKESSRKMSIMPGVIPVGWQQCLVRLQVCAQPTLRHPAGASLALVVSFLFIITSAALRLVYREQDIEYKREWEIKTNDKHGNVAGEALTYLFPFPRAASYPPFPARSRKFSLLI